MTGIRNANLFFYIFNLSRFHHLGLGLFASFYKIFSFCKYCGTGGNANAPNHSDKRNGKQLVDLDI